MRISPLQLDSYFLTEVHLTVNKDFDPAKEPPMNDHDFVVEVDCSPAKEDDKRKWQVGIKLQFQPAADANVPYRFTLAIIGLFFVVPEYPQERITQLVKVNGPSMLYGILREVVRDLTSRGPYMGMLLPSASFIDAAIEPKAASEPATAPEPAEKPETAAETSAPTGEKK